MTKTSKKSGPEIDPDAIYKVTLKEPVRIGRTLLRARDVHRIKGVHLQAHLDKIASFEAI